MRRIIEFFVRQSLFGDLVTLAVIGIGLYSLFAIRREVFPIETRSSGAKARKKSSNS